MIFSSPAWVPPLVQEASDSIAVGDVVLSGRGESHDDALFVDGVSGQSYSANVLRSRVESLARGLGRDLNWSPSTGSAWDKVVAIYSVNTIDYFVLCWAIHRLNGICMPLHSSCTADEVKSHLITAKCQTIFTCPELLSTCLEASQELSISQDRIYSLTDFDAQGTDSEQEPLRQFKSVEQLISRGAHLSPLQPLKWEPGQGKSQVAFLCATSGTSGRQKLAQLTHYGLITNVLQMITFESFANGSHRGTATGAIPFSHSYGLLIGHVGTWRRDALVVFPRFDMQLMLSAVSRHAIERLYLVPPILGALSANSFLLQQYDLSSVTSVVTGAAPLDDAVATKLLSHQPKWKFLHAWGSTETCIVATLTSAHDIWLGSSGPLLPGCQLRLVGAQGDEIDAYGQPGEILYKAPNVFAGYLGDESSSRDSFDADGWLRTGDVGEMRLSPNGTQHLFIRDRIKDMIKVKGMQVVPVDIERVLVKHPAVIEAAVIGIHDDLAGERPMAFVVISESGATADAGLVEELRDSIDDHVEAVLHETHWLHGRIEFVPAIPKSQSGKVLKRQLRDAFSAVRR